MLTKEQRRAFEDNQMRLHVQRYYAEQDPNAYYIRRDAQQVRRYFVTSKVVFGLILILAAAGFVLPTIVLAGIAAIFRFLGIP